MYIFKVNISDFKPAYDSFDVKYFNAMDRSRALEELDILARKGNNTRTMSIETLVMLTEMYAAGGYLVDEDVRVHDDAADVTLYIVAEDYITANNILKQWLSQDFKKSFEKQIEGYCGKRKKPKKSQKDR